MKWAEEGGARRRGRPWAAIASYAGLTAFLVVFLLLGMFNHADFTKKKKKPRFDFPDFDRVEAFTRVLSDDDVSLNNTNNRVIFVGDVHGMNESLHDLLNHLSYKPAQDTLIFAGDLLAKSTHASSLSVLDFLTHNHVVNGKERIFPVRGNHDQLVVQWRAWREWFQTLKLASYERRFSRGAIRDAVAHLSSLPDRLVCFLKGPSADAAKIPAVSTGEEFLHLLEAEWAIARMEKDADPEEYAEVARKRSIGTWREDWWKRIPEPGTGKYKQQWRLFGDHYWLARDMAEEHASYLTSLPLVLHIPHLHLFVAHGGLLPSDPRLKPTNPKQPLARIPVLDLQSSALLEIATPPIIPSQLSMGLSKQEPLESDFRPSADEAALRQAQESAILTDVPQNTDAWTVLNIRSVRKNGKVTRNGDKGKPWSKLWNKEMKSCAGFDSSGLSEDEEETTKKHRKDEDDFDLPCLPSTVVYGHAATRGLDIKRWSMGLDTGCLYGRRLTALVLKNSTSGKHDEDGDEDDDEDDDDEDDDEDDDDEDDDEDDDDDDGEDGGREDDEDEDDDEDLDWTGSFDDEGDELDLRPRRVRFGDKDMHISARLESVKCPLIDFNS